MNREVICFDAVAPARERGLKSYRTDGVEPVYAGRSREGAWIEIGKDLMVYLRLMVAPARERGLKYNFSPSFLILSRRSLPRGSVD